MLSDDPVWKSRDGFCIGNIEAMPAHAHALSNLFCGLAHSGFVDIGEGKMAAAARKRYRNSPADSAARAGYDSYAAFKLQQS